MCSRLHPMQLGQLGAPRWQSGPGATGAILTSTVAGCNRKRKADEDASHVPYDSAAPQDSHAADEPVLSPKLLAAQQLVQPGVQTLFQALTAAAGPRSTAAGQGQPAAAGVAALYASLMAAVAGNATPEQAKQAAAAANEAEAYAPLLVLFEPRALCVLLLVTAPPGAEVQVAAVALRLACEHVIASPGTSLLHHFRKRMSSRKPSWLGAKTPAAAAMQEPQGRQPPAEKRARLPADGTAAPISNTSSNNSTSSGRMPLPPDAALELLLCAPDGAATRRFWNKHLKRPAAIDGIPSDLNPLKLDFLRGVHYLPAACDDILAVLVEKRTEAISPQAAADRVKLLRACAAKFA